MRYLPTPRIVPILLVGLALFLVPSTAPSSGTIPAENQATTVRSGDGVPAAAGRAALRSADRRGSADRGSLQGIASGASSFAVPSGDGRFDGGGGAPGRVALTRDAVASATGPSVPAAWTVVAHGDLGARTVFTSHGEVRPTVLLGPGRYELGVAYGTVRRIERFEIPPGAPPARELRRVVLDAGTLRPVAVLARERPPLEGHWTVLADAVPGLAPGATVATDTSRTPAFHLAPGRYRLSFRSGQVRSETVVTIAAGRTVQPRLVLRAADVTLVSLRRGRPLLGVQWQVFERPRQGGPPAATPLAGSDAPRARFVLPAGNYVARVFADGRWYEQPFAVAAGAVGVIPLPLP